MVTISSFGEKTLRSDQPFNAVTRVPRQINLIPTTSEMMIFYDTFDFTACCLYVTATLIFAAVVPKTLNVNNSMLASIDNNTNFTLLT